MLPWLGNMMYVYLTVQLRSMLSGQVTAILQIALRDFTLGWFEFSPLSAKVFVKRWLKFYNRHLIWLLCVLCLSDYGNEAPFQSIKVHQFISGVILGDVIFAQRQICQNSSMQVEVGGMFVTQATLVALQAYIADMCVWAWYLEHYVLWGTHLVWVWHHLLMYHMCLQWVHIALIIQHVINTATHTGWINLTKINVMVF